MKKCNNCGTELNDDILFCLNCGARCDAPKAGEASAAQQPQPNPVYEQFSQNPQPVFDPCDHTAEFDPADVHENKLMALLCYLGVLALIPLLCAEKTPYVKFHIRQALKLLICYAVTGTAAALLAWTVIVPLAAACAAVVLAVVNIIGFVNTAKNLSKELPVVKSVTFLD